MIRSILIVSFAAVVFQCAAQTAPGKYWVRFTDKDNSPFSLDHPQEFLSPEAVLRRAVYGIPYDLRDLPVNESYVEEVLSMGECVLHNRSKWFNAITIATEDTLLIEQIAQLPFVAETRSVVSWTQPDKGKIGMNVAMPKADACGEWEKSYGPSFRQIEMLNGHMLHQLGFRGQGMKIAVLDGGFWLADVLPAFAPLRARGGILGTRDFVAGGESVYGSSNHGTFVLSLMAGIIPDSLCGTAPDANYWLFRTEDVDSEYLVEEDNWVAAAEVCDSLGIDIINSSLGYSLFDDSLQHHSYADMDGNTTRVSIAADIAAEKGILVVNSAGNSGNNAWHYITAPSDGDSVLCVGAVDAFEWHSGFSGFGPSSDGDTKPNVCAMGSACVIADLDSTIRTGSGTSFSSPIMAGMSACLWQAFRAKDNMDIFKAIERSADLYFNPNDSLGHGIPDFWLAFLQLRGQDYNTVAKHVELWPNPAVGSFNMLVNEPNACSVSVKIFDLSGRLVYETASLADFGEISVLRVDPSVADGHYLVGIYIDGVEVDVQRVVITGK
ncbi:MAG: S8 family serine peptidase [Flavobacteriales bacterium]|nr:S8 family serine peptidase [Flavobacteriales bacterium]